MLLLIGTIVSCKEWEGANNNIHQPDKQMIMIDDYYPSFDVD